MQLVEQHSINPTDSRFGAIDAAAFAAKNLYNAANCQVRQSFIHEGVYLNYGKPIFLIVPSRRHVTLSEAKGRSRGRERCFAALSMTCHRDA